MAASPRLSLPLLNRRQRPHAAWEMSLIVLGCLAMAMSFRLFMNANQLVAGGVVGVSTILDRKLHWDPALVQYGINLPLLAVGFLALGKGEGMRSLLGSLALPLCILLTKPIAPITHNPLLASVFGGLGYGVGLGLVLIGRGSVGGYSLLALVAARKTSLTVPSAIFVLDAITITTSGVLFGPEKALYGLISAFLMRRAIESVITGFSRSFMALIISEKHEEIRTKVLVDLDRGLTVLAGTGGYSNQERPVLCVVLGQAEIPQLRAAVRETDPDAFVVITHASEVLGQGFHRG